MTAARAPNVVTPIRTWTSLIGGARTIGVPPVPSEGGIVSQGALSALTASGAAVAKAVVAPVSAAAAPPASASSKPAAAAGVRQPGLSYKLALGSASSSAKGEQTLVTAGEDTLGVATSSDVADGAASRLKQFYPANSPWALLQGTVQASEFDADAADDVGAAGPPSISRSLKAPPLSADLASAEEFVPGAFGFAS